MSGGIVGVGAPDPGTAQLINRLANPPNPLEQVGQSMNALTALKEYQAQNALTGIYQQSIDPVTGQVDLGEFNMLARQNPAALWKFGQTMQSAGTGVGNEGQGTTAQLNAKLDQLGAQAAYMTPLITKAQAGTVTADDVRSVLKDIPPGVIPPTTLANINQQLADGADPNNVVRGAFFANQHGRDILNSALGPIATVNQGPQTSFVRQPPFAQGGTAPPLPMGLTPDQAAQPFTLTFGNQSIQTTVGAARTLLDTNPNLWNALSPEQQQALRAAGYPGPGAAAPAPGTGHYGAPAPAPAPAPGGGAPAEGGGGGGGAPKPPTTAAPPYLQPPPPETGAPGSAPPGQLPAGGGVGVAPQPGVVKTQEQQAGVSSSQLADLTTAVNQAPTTKALLNDMRSQLQVAGWEPGLGAQTGSGWRQILQRLNVQAGGTGDLNINNAQAAQEEFNKDANLIAGRQLQALGNPSDARQQLSEMSTPGTALSKEGNIGLTSTLLGNQHALEITNRAFQQAKANGWSDNKYAQWVANNWNATDATTGGKFDPRIFWMADTPGGRQGQWNLMAKKIPTDQQAQFAKNLKYAASQGWVKQQDDGSWSVSEP